MLKYLYKETFNEDCTDKYSYYLVCDGEKLGVEIQADSGDNECCVIEDTEESAIDVLKVVSDGEVCPGHLSDILEDRKSERFLEKLSRNLIQAYLKTTFNSC